MRNKLVGYVALPTGVSLRKKVSLLLRINGDSKCIHTEENCIYIVRFIFIFQ